MKRSTALVVALGIVHTVVTAAALFEEGYFAIFRIAFTDLAAGQIFSDLAVSLVLISVWMIRDARARGLNAWPFVLAMLPLGSFAWLAYLLVRELRAPVSSSAASR